MSAAEQSPDTDWLVDGGEDVGEIAEKYDDWATTYDDELDSWSYQAPEIAAALAIAHGTDLDPILDAGCGTGRVGRALRRLGFEGGLYGGDASPASLDVARDAGGYDDLSVIDLQEDLDWADDQFGAVTCVGVMTYVPDVEACWREFARVARSGAVIVVTQRDDIWDDRETQAAIDAIESDGLWTPIAVTEPRPYLPTNADFGDDITVRYVIARVN